MGAVGMALPNTVRPVRLSVASMVRVRGITEKVRMMTRAFASSTSEWPEAQWLKRCGFVCVCARKQGMVVALAGSLTGLFSILRPLSARDVRDVCVDTAIEYNAY